MSLLQEELCIGRTGDGEFLNDKEVGKRDADVCSVFLCTFARVPILLSQHYQDPLHQTYLANALREPILLKNEHLRFFSPGAFWSF